MTQILSQSQLEGQLRGFRLSGMAKTLGIRLKQTGSQSLSYTEFLGLLLEDEINTRADNRRQRLYKNAKLAFEKGLEDFDFTFQPSINRRVIFELATCQFLAARRPLVRESGVRRPKTPRKGRENVCTGFKTLLYGMLVVVRKDMRL
jgi:DNA replication protein DnaC